MTKNIVPRGTGQGELGTSTKKWSKVHANEVNADAITIDNIALNGATIGHTSDTDLITLANGVVTVAGDLSATTLKTNYWKDASGNTMLADGGTDLYYYRGHRSAIGTFYIKDSSNNERITFSTGGDLILNKGSGGTQITGSLGVSGDISASLNISASGFYGDGLNIDSGTLFVDATTNQTRIGTDTAVVNEKLLVRQTSTGVNTGIMLSKGTNTGDEYLSFDIVSTDVARITAGAVGNGGNNALAFATSHGPDDPDESEKMRISSDGKVGIGTTNPAALLHLEGGDARIHQGRMTINYEGKDAADNSTLDEFGLIVTDETANIVGTETGIGFRLSTVNTPSTYSPGGAITFELRGNQSQGDLHFKTKGSSANADLDTRMTVEQGGKVGIGTKDPDHQLSVIGDISASLNISASAFYGDGSNITGVTGEWDGTHNGNAEITGSLFVGDALVDGGAQDSVTPAGIVSINKNDLDAADDTTIDQYHLLLTRDSNTNGNESGIGFRVSTNLESGSVSPGGAISFERTDSASRGNLHFKTKSGAGSVDLDTRMTIHSNGLVGINKTSTSSMYKFMVDGRSSLENTVVIQNDSLNTFANSGISNWQNYHLLLVGDGDTGDGTALGFYNDNNVGASIIFKDAGSYGRGELQFYTKESTSSGTAPVQRMTIDADGKVGINKTTGMTHQLEVVGNVSASINVSASGFHTDDLEITGDAIKTAGSNRFRAHSSNTYIYSAGGSLGQTISSTGTSLNAGKDFTVDTDTFFVDASEDKVGINKNSGLTHALNVVGAISASGDIVADQMQQYISVRLSTQTSSTSSEFNPFQTTGGSANGGTSSTNASNGITYDSGTGGFTIAHAGVYEIEFVAHLNQASSGNLSKFDVVKTPNGGSPSVLTNVADTYVHSSTDPVERTLSGFFTLAANDVITVALDGSSLIAKVGSTLNIKRIA